jgi:hypothetical protein
MGGSSDLKNLIHLTAREHFLAHWLLWRIYRTREMAFAFHAMCVWNNGRGKFSSIAYSESRENAAKMRSDFMKTNVSERSVKMKIAWDNKTDEEREEHIKSMIKSKSHKKAINDAKKLEWLKSRVRTYPLIGCPSCGKVGRSGVMKRWHFDNCKA